MTKTQQNKIDVLNRKIDKYKEKINLNYTSIDVKRSNIYYCWEMIDKLKKEIETIKGEINND